ncbi:glycosyltransferase family 4 protein [Rhodospirillaceae bacterium KN72]|uniref:Glycosyltransferase family 4 protein n=1 Tax=Pacificispira spongiicola TaxID=2729598 RepID=A0A7Y0E114_9PROT|nr:glycosyltransferase family 4 protein [Pacificispira spongiicola]NMM45168.1 glycosyltransferase family 4 protein [Pacificispira spongiicola]
MTPRIAFHAPLKPPTHPVPSGDRRFARLLMQALRRAGFTVDLASRLRSRNAAFDPAVQSRLDVRATRIRDRLSATWRRDGAPDLWMTYHLYDKAPDLLGPVLCREFSVPYVVVEASLSPRRTGTPAHALVEAALRQAALILQPNPKDLPEVARLNGVTADQVRLPPFLDVARDVPVNPSRRVLRREMAMNYGINPDSVWAVATGMMRPGGKTESFRILAAACRKIDADFTLLILGDGDARDEVEAAFSGDGRVRFLGAVDRATVGRVNRAADLFVWPAIQEAFGMAPLEAQAAGLPVVAGDRPGLRGIVDAGVTGLLVPEGDVDAFADAMRHLLTDDAGRARMAAAARAHVLANHDIGGAAALLRRTLLPLIEKGRAA